MKKIISNILILPFLMMGLAACESESLSITFGGEDQGYYTLSLKSRAEVPDGESGKIDSDVDLNEDEIQSYDLFFFKSSGFNEETSEYLKHYSETDLNATTNCPVNIPTNDDLILDGTTEYVIYAVVNRPVTETFKTMAELKALTANKDITVDNGDTTEDDENIQDFFVMDGTLVTTLNKSASTTPVIPLERAASKISLHISFPKITITESGAEKEVEGIEVNDVIYTPVTGAMNVSLVKGVKNGTINNGPIATDLLQYLDNVSTKREIVHTEDDYTHTPFYSYPSDWSTNEDNECYLYLSIPWINKNTGNQISYYYIVPIGDTNGYVTKLERNTHYKINLNVAVLGGEIEEEVRLEPTYIIEKWSEETIPTALKKYQYLWVETNEVTVYNQNQVKIAYASSDAVSAVITSIKKPDYSKDEADLDRLIYSNSTGSGSISADGKNLLTPCSVTIGKDGTIILNHELINERKTGSEYDYVPYTITIVVTNESGMTEEIEIIQYPSCYIYSFVDDSNPTNSTLSDGGTVWVNGTQGGRTNPDIGQVPNKYPGNNERNPNMYVVTVTAFDEHFGENYIIGDPRVDEVNTLGFNSWTTAPHIDGGNNKTLTYYYPTRTDSSNYIAPRFMITSAYSYPGGTTYSKEQVTRRCASLQENGFPAGRWRVPTNAEVEFIAKMCVEGKIPQIFTSNVRYHSATNVYAFNTQTNSVAKTNQTTGSVRCVYDLWYWGENDRLTGDKLNVFTWGDRIKQ